MNIIKYIPILGGNVDWATGEGYKGIPCFLAARLCIGNFGFSKSTKKIKCELYSNDILFMIIRVKTISNIKYHSK